MSIKNNEIHMPELGKNEQAEELITRTEVDDSPFTIIGTQGTYFGTMGKYRITEEYGSEAEVSAVLTKITWNRVVQVIAIMIENRELLINKIIEE